MARKKKGAKPKPRALKFDVYELLVNRGDFTDPKHIAEALNAPRTKVSWTLGMMFKHGSVTREVRGKAYFYKATIYPPKKEASKEFDLRPTDTAEVLAGIKSRDQFGVWAVMGYQLIGGAE